MSVAFNLQRLIARIRPALGDGTSTLISLHVLTVFIRFGSSLIVSRLFAPDAYGAIGVIMSISYILGMISDLGLRAYITRHPTADENLLQTVWTVLFIRNVILAAVMFFGAPVLANLYSAPQITDGIRVAALFFLLDGVRSLSFFTGERQRRVIRLSVINFVSTLIMTAVTIVAAYFLRTYWAVIIAMFVSSAYLVFATYRLVPGPRVGFRLDLAHVADLWRFLRFVLPASMISIVLTQTDKFFLANFFPLEELGKFILVSSIAMAAAELVTEYGMRVAFPLIAQVMREDENAAAKIFYSSRRRFTLALAFLIGGVIGGGGLVVQILFNDLYLGAGFYLSILCFQPLAKLMTVPAQQALIAKGLIQTTLISNIIRLAWVFIAGGAAYFQFGAMGVVVAISLAEAATLPFFWRQLQRIGFFSVREELFVLAAAGIGAALGFAGQSAVVALIAAGYLPSF